MANRPSPDSEHLLPANTDAERYVLGSILMDEVRLAECDLQPEDFMLEKHRRIWRRILDLRAAGDPVNRISVMNELVRFNELESCDGLSYLISLDDGLPHIPNIKSYAGIVKEKSSLRRIIYLAEKAKTVSFAQEHSALKILGDLSRSVTKMEIGMGRAKRLMTPADIIESHGGIQGFAMGAIDPGESFGMPQLDELLIGMQRQCQYIIAGRTSSGKSALAMNLAVNVAKRGIPVHIASVEMSKEIWIARTICSIAKVPLKAYIRQDLMSDQRKAVIDAAGMVAELPIYIDDQPGMTITGYVRSVDEAVQEQGCRLSILDHIHRIDWAGDRDLRLKDEYNGITHASWAANMCARKHNISTLVCCQLNRPADKKRTAAPPVLEDLRASGALEQDATGIIMLFRKEVYFPGRPELRGQAQAFVRKSRNASLGVAHLKFIGKYTTFVDEGRPDDAVDEETAT